MKDTFNYSRVYHEKKSRKPLSDADFEAANAKKLEHDMSVRFTGDMATKKLEVGDRYQIFSMVLGIIGKQVK